jgi:hypothetical protein
MLTRGTAIGTTHDFRCGLLHSGTSTPLSGANHTSIKDYNFVSDLEAAHDEVTVGQVASYARQALTGESETEDDTNDWSLLDAADIAFGTLETGAIIIAAFIYKHNGAPDTANELLAVYDLTVTPTNGGTVTVTTASGYATLS